jgi:fused signal recognition particle receptor
MAFFKKLRERMFKSSSKLDEGLEAIVAEGGSAVPEVPHAPEPAPQSEPQPVPPPLAPEPVPLPDPEPEPEQVPPPVPDVPVPEPVPEPEPARQPRPDIPEIPVPYEPEPAHEPFGIPAAPSEVPAAPPVELPDTPEPMPDTGPVEIPGGIVGEAPTPQKPGFFGRILGRPAEAPVVRRELDDTMLEQLEELLITADMGVDTAMRVTANLAEGRLGRRLSVAEIKELLATEITRIMEPVARPLPIYPKKPQVILVVGVNGSGKTTTIGKLASQFRAAGKKVVIAAGDTFRAAAVEQLQVWGERAGVPVLTAPEGSDPASLAFDAMTKAEAEGADLLLIDTAGRLQNRQDLMEELSKIVRVIRKKDPEAPHNTLLVLDATTGQNALNQVEIFRNLADVSGLVMTKLDGTAKGGVLVALADRFGLPIHAIGVGEQIDDLAPFDPEDFARALTGAAA